LAAADSAGYNYLMRVYLPRFYVMEFAANLARMEADLADAANLDCEMIVFPELFLTGYHGTAGSEQVRAELARASAAQPGVLCVWGAISEAGVNRQLVFKAGRELAAYDKVHLFLPNGEGEFWRRGNAYCALQAGGWTIGLATCNDVRFPEQARALKLAHDIDLLLYPALWPWARDHVWSALLRARAIENGIFVIGCCVAGIDNEAELFDGAGNHVYDPLGEELHPRQRVYELDRERLREVLVDTKAQYCAITDVLLFKE
jgi:omega-amidase